MKRLATLVCAALFVGSLIAWPVSYGVTVMVSDATGHGHERILYVGRGALYFDRDVTSPNPVGWHANFALFPSPAIEESHGFRYPRLLPFRHITFSDGSEVIDVLSLWVPVLFLGALTVWAWWLDRKHSRVAAAFSVVAASD